MPGERSESVDLIVAMATIDWVDMSMIWAEVRRSVGREAPPVKFAAALGELVGELIDRDVVPGALGADPDFQPWPGTRGERVARVVAETMALGRWPWPNDVAWFSYEPPTGAGSAPVPD